MQPVKRSEIKTDFPVDSAAKWENKSLSEQFEKLNIVENAQTKESEEQRKAYAELRAGEMQMANSVVQRSVTKGPISDDQKIAIFALPLCGPNGLMMFFLPVGFPKGENKFFICKEVVEMTLKISGANVKALLNALIAPTKTRALPPVSEYYVGAAGLGKSGNIYLGVNFEIPNCPLNQTVHAEQFLISNARHLDETELEYIALSAAPCGHCRQFIRELGQADSDKLNILIQDREKPSVFTERAFSSLLPDSFGPGVLNNPVRLLKDRPAMFKSNHSDVLTAKAIEAAHMSHAPYTGALSGVAIRTKDGKTYCGSHLENVAFNPSMSPLQDALVMFIAAGRDYEEIDEVILAELESAKISQEEITKMVLKAIAPNARLQVVKFSK